MVLKNYQFWEGGCQKFRKIANVVYGWSLKKLFQSKWKKNESDVEV
jgi:hypothetical protein